jgi:hypothetical protein
MIHPPLWSSLTLEFDAPPPSAGHHHGLHVPPLSSAEPDDGACPITRLRASGFCRFDSYAAHRFRQIKRYRAAECGLSRDRTTERIAPGAVRCDGCGRVARRRERCRRWCRHCPPASPPAGRDAARPPQPRRRRARRAARAGVGPGGAHRSVGAVDPDRARGHGRTLWVSTVWSTKPAGWAWSRTPPSEAATRC